MTILDDAIGLEERARTYYAQAAEKVTNPSGKKILTLLVNERKRHAEPPGKMKDGLHGEHAHSNLLRDVRGLVEGVAKERKNVIFSDSSLREILQKAMEIE